METIELDNVTIARLNFVRRILEKPGEGVDLSTALAKALNVGLDALGAPIVIEVPVAAPPRCSVCERDDRKDIDAALTLGKSINVTAAWFGVSRGTLQRHAKHLHIPR